MTLQTDRLVLRPLEPGYAGPITDALQDWETVRWLSAVPWPYALEDARWFIEECAAGRIDSLAVTHEGQLIGVMGGGDEFGYWFARSAWGQGFATEAARAYLDSHFADPAAGPVLSGHYLDNARSRRVLDKLGFRETGPRPLHSRALGREFESMRMRLDRSDWEASVASRPQG
ncbi:GNAT family N-acetyltransferase [Histidinibacterium aquaticum]|uniref:GNAT family N-acetyltransferase n=1 Tax=Histidinibacterium aquaticum TaxID=2613962 RepID=UPI00168AA727|nr:GNAT family N-acetyltransferase [Histidinibacterium aquaticum]